MKKSCICLLCLLYVFTPARAQNLPIGDRMPALKVKNVFNYDRDWINFDDFKGKLVIVDFWSFGSTACFTSFPKMEELQNRFGDRIRVILVNRETKSQTK